MVLAMPAMMTSSATKVRYVIQNSGSTFTLRTFAAGLLSAFAHNPTISIPDFEGEVLVNTEAPQESSLRLVVRAASLAVADDMREWDRNEINRIMRDEVLEVDSYPEIVYEGSARSATRTSEGRYSMLLDGDLQLHGERRPQSFAARVEVNGDIVRAGGEFAIRQSDYDLRPVSAVGGAIRINDEVKFRFDILARRQP